MFTPLFDDTFETRAQNVSTDSAAQTVNTQVPDTSITTTTVETDAPSTESPTADEQTDSNSCNAPEDLNQQEVPEPANYDPNAFFNRLHQLPTFLIYQSRQHGTWNRLICSSSITLIPLHTTGLVIIQFSTLLVIHKLQ